MVHITGWLKGLQVTADGTGIVSHAGVALVRALADNTGLTAGLSKALASDRLLVHDRGRVLADLACAIADGAEVIVAVVILVLFGSKKLPHAARSLGQSMRILKREVEGLHEDEPDSGSPSTVAAPAELTASPLPAQQAQIDALQQQIRDLQRTAARDPADGAASPAQAQVPRHTQQAG
jgi:TatA/E family protein of Tat protein translocase